MRLRRKFSKAVVTGVFALSVMMVVPAAGAIASIHMAAGGHGAAVHRAVHHRPGRHRAPRVRNEPWLPAPLVGFEVHYVPPRGDPMLRLPRQVQRLFACVRWREGGDEADQPNGAGMYQFTNRSTWDEFRGRFSSVPSDATAEQQDIVAARAWRNEQFYPWRGDPCLGSLVWITHDGRAFGWY